MLETKNIKISKGALEAIEVLENAGFKADLVGGCVRDSILGREAKDEDITTNLQPEEVLKLFKNKGYRVIPTGLQHGTVTVMIKNEGEYVGYEITTYRIDGEYEDSRHPNNVTFVDDIRLDMERRDLTINAMAYNPKRGLTDHFGGINDLDAKIIRTVGSPVERFKEDALRMMRAIRFSAQLGFSIAEEVKDAIKNNAKDINNVSSERIHDELIKILKSPNPSKGIKALYELNLLKEILPEFEKCFDDKLGRQNNPWHIYSVGEHTLKALENTPNDLIVRMAALCHDLGKPVVRTTDEEGIDHFYKHPIVSTELTYSLMKRLKFTNKERDAVVTLVKLHDYRFVAERKCLEKFIIKHPEVTPELFEKLIVLQKADNLGQNPELTKGRIDLLNEIYDIYKEIVAGPYRECDLAINGNDIMSISSTLKGEEIKLENKEIRIAKQMLLEFVIKDSSRNTKEELITFVRREAKNIKARAK
jgi:tRNA nucleotidyltransferase (CCA-adding enzyme)